MSAIAHHRLVPHRCTAAILMALAMPIAAQAQTPPTAPASQPAYLFDIPAQALSNALQAFARASRQQVSFDGAVVEGKTSTALTSNHTAEEAIRRLLQGTGLSYRRGPQGVWMVGPPQPPGPTSYEFDIAPQSLAGALEEFSSVAGQPLDIDQRSVRGKGSAGLQGRHTVDEGLRYLLIGTGLEADRESSGIGAIGIRAGREDTPVSPSTGEADAGSAAAEAESADIIVTGTNIRGGTTIAPKRRIGEDDWRRDNVATVEGAIQKLPQNFSGDISSEVEQVGAYGGIGFTGFNSSRGTSVNLRGLLSNSTLTLLDGQRLPSGSLGVAPDISFIPIIAMNAIDVVLDGGSAIYGADAVAGVVNLITKEPGDGSESIARVEVTSDGALSRYQLGQSGGITAGPWGALLAIQYDKQTPLEASDRERSGVKTGSFQLFPATEQISVFGKVAGEWESGARLTLTALHGERDIESVNDNPFGFVTQVVEALQSSVLASLRLPIASKWDVTSQFTYSTTQTDVAGTFVNPFGTSRDVVLNDNEVLAGNAVVTGDLIRIGSRSLKVASGISYLREKISAEKIEGADAPRENNVERDSFAIFAEALLPFGTDVTPFLPEGELSGAVRYDRYSDFGETTNYRVALQVRPHSSIELRATYATAFRAPSLFELNEFSLLAFTFQGMDSRDPGTVKPALVLSGGNPTLGPEESKSFTFGAQYEAIPNQLQIGLNYFNINVQGRIATPDQQSAFLSDLGFPPIQQFIQVNPSTDSIARFFAIGNFFDFGGGSSPDNIEVLVDNRFQNLSSLKAEGFDFSIDGTHRAANYAIIGTANATYLHRFALRPSSAALELDRAGEVFFPPSFRARGSFSLELPQATTTISLNYTGSFRDTRPTAQQTDIDGLVTVDANISFRSCPDCRKPFEFVLGVSNLFNEPPPFIESLFGDAPNYDPANASILGRLVSLQLRKKW